MVKNGCGQSRYENPKLNEWLVGINLFFAWLYKFKKAKSCFNDFWLGSL